ncbi:MAG: hypothetical protein KatS3mg057_2142 [Herpetosiphonaceae bacterium]|nr:MAG: hypothetical protein KatS3mg057_2142 [Herpetosiphonaceae bacterium]
MMELEMGKHPANTPEKAGQTSSASQLEAWLEAWPTHRQALSDLIRAHAREDPGYSWLTADRELQLMDNAVQRIMAALKNLQRTAGKR